MMSSERDLLARNYCESAKLAQHSIYVSYLMCVSIALLIHETPNDSATIPLIGLNAGVSSAILATMGIYLASGFLCFFAIKQCLAAKCQLEEESELIRALKTYPSVIHARGFFRFCVLLLPWGILYSTLIINSDRPELLAFALTGGFSCFHIAAFFKTCDSAWREPLYVEEDA